jgi:hypothetical protein
VEIGWRLRSDMWGNGYATEAARSCLHYASLSKMESIISFTALSNLRSQRVMQRLGMTRLQEFDHPALPTGHPLRRHVLYMIRTNGYAETEPETKPHCSLTIIPEEEENILPKRFEYEGNSIILNRENTEMSNRTITSKEQAEIVFDDGHWYLLDRSMLQTTYIQVNRKIEIIPDDIIVLGDRRFKFECD